MSPIALTATSSRLAKPRKIPSSLLFEKIEPASIDFSILRNWLLHCQTHHSASCAPLGQVILQEIRDLKLIDCQTRQVVKAPRKATYAALSYVWGKYHAAEVTVFNRSSLPETLPRTIEDAIQVVLRLDLQYLWVDKYCIDQSSETELAQQISTMDLIYNAAFCTIVAACGEDASFGLPGVGLTRRLEQPAIHLNGQVWVSSLRDPGPMIKTSTWASRAWTYQEGLFSRRRLIFTEEQVYFECNRSKRVETASYDFNEMEFEPMTHLSAIFNGGISSSSFEDGIHGNLDKHIEAYTRRTLSFQKDIINALSGVFRIFSCMPTPTRHFWGVPMDYNLHGDSCWPTNNAVIEPEPSHRFEGYVDAAFARGLCWFLDMPCPRRPGFPSWSWSGWIGPLAPHAWGLLGYFRDSEVKIWLRRANGEYERLSESVVGSISKRGPRYTGYTPMLRIEAWVIETSLTYIADGPRDVYFPPLGMNSDPLYFVSIEAPSAGGIHSTLRWPVVLSVQVEGGDELHGELCRGTFTCVLLSKESDFGLLVRRQAQGIMERIGHVSIYRSLFDDMEDDDMEDDNAEDDDVQLEFNMLDIFPLTRRTILLG